MLNKQNSTFSAHARLLQRSNLHHHEQLIDLTRSAIGTLVTTLPQLPYSVYLTGSVARMTSDAASDLDIAIVYPDNCDTVRARVRAFFQEIKPNLPPLDLTIFEPLEINGIFHNDDELFRRREILIPIYEHGLLLYGTDIRVALTPHIEDLISQVTVHMPWAFSRRARGFQELLHPINPIEPPDKTDEFLGYTKFGSIKLLLSIASWIATAKLAIYRDCTPIGGKEKLFEVLSQRDPELTNWLSEIWFLFRNEWGYTVPSGKAQRRKLASICNSVWRMEIEFSSDYAKAISLVDVERRASCALYPAH